MGTPREAGRTTNDLTSIRLSVNHPNRQSPGDPHLISDFPDPKGPIGKGSFGLISIFYPLPSIFLPASTNRARIESGKLLASCSSHLLPSKSPALGISRLRNLPPSKSPALEISCPPNLPPSQSPALETSWPPTSRPPSSPIHLLHLSLTRRPECKNCSDSR